jgi:hypothetical protein
MKLKITGNIVRMEEAQMDEYGRFDEEKEAIFIRAGLKGLQRHRTELHEILHAIWLEFDLPKHEEETCVRRLEAGLTAFVMDNPQYAMKLFGALTRFAATRD